MAGLKLGKYKHFKGNLYEVVAVARHSETLEEFVVYKALYDNELSIFWVRPKAMFIGRVSVNGREIDRFEFIG